MSQDYNNGDLCEQYFVEPNELCISYSRYLKFIDLISLKLDGPVEVVQRICYVDPAYYA